MSKKRAPAFLFLISPLSTLAYDNDHRETLILQGEAFPPYVITSENEVKGLAIDLVKEIDQHLSLSKPEIRIVPWNRTFQAFSNGMEASALLVSETLIEKFNLKRAGPIASCKYSLFTAAGKKKIETLDEARKLRSIGVSENSSTERHAKRLGLKNIKSYSHSPVKIEELLVRRLDAWLGCEAAIQYRSCRSLGSQPNIKKTITIGTENFYIAFSQNTSNHIVEDWEKAISLVKEKNVYKKLTKKYSYECNTRS
ncbi:transporter substrate-binding domain-containing protein [Pseudoteredinibacter isoporae]|uniref:Polar amino acid transport system substrate-binding protein n=1 Tax=Pseudoteredinibacter isoporae TaxID=570281 RepID=A0A7X0JXE8_9GAMM|nr:polar amino acid transport system substrate-binding protein [Pseudoteredinibacter isoporae]NHO88699.1 transporter substrate-binding domain-containing protein [Pseudoteredinibacter isoporae]NIB22610.1 transporter substrate-binding domain-containing protein [Pseudoteredinibacter isoporae]